MIIKSTLPHWDLKNKCVLLRVDLNVPLENGKILDDNRLQAIKPTLDFLLEQGATVFIATHIGRPKGPEKNLSTALLLPWFENQGYTVTFSKDIDTARKIGCSKPNTIVLLENLRFDPGEKSRHIDFAKKLAQLGDYYVNDAFGVLHRNDSSITLTPEQFSSEKRTIGFLVEKELQSFAQLLKNPKKPFVAIIGGAKIKTKLPFIESLLSKAQTILLCPALSFTFSKALGDNVGKSLVDDTALKTCKEIINKAKAHNINIVLPADYLIAQNTIQGPLSSIDADNFPDNGYGISIGPKTIKEFSKYIENAKTIFWNGTFGFFSRPETLTSMIDLLKIVGKTNCNIVIAGGDAVAGAQKSGLKDIDHFSTGGGSTLALITDAKLPGLLVFKTNGELSKHRAKTNQT